MIFRKGNKLNTLFLNTIYPRKKARENFPELFERFAGEERLDLLDTRPEQVAGLRLQLGLGLRHEVITATKWHN